MEIQGSQKLVQSEKSLSSYSVKSIAISLFEGMCLVSTYPIEAEVASKWASKISEYCPGISNEEITSVFDAIVSGKIDFDRHSGVVGVLNAIREVRNKKKTEEDVNERNNWFAQFTKS